MNTHKLITFPIKTVNASVQVKSTSFFMSKKGGIRVGQVRAFKYNKLLKKPVYFSVNTVGFSDTKSNELFQVRYK